VGRGVVTGHKDDMGDRRVAAPPAGVDGPGIGEGEARRLQGADANPMVAPPKLVPRALGLGVDHRRIHPDSTGDFGLRRLDRSPLAKARIPLKRWSAV
jgi:hypothetical protein